MTVADRRRRVRHVDPMPFDHVLPDSAEQYMQDLADAYLEHGFTVRVAGGDDGVVLYVTDPETLKTSVAWRWTWDRSALIARGRAAMDEAMNGALLGLLRQVARGPGPKPVIVFWRTRPNRSVSCWAPAGIDRRILRRLVEDQLVRVDATTRTAVVTPAGRRALGFDG